jgi:hypothetical protein
LSKEKLLIYRRGKKESINSPKISVVHLKFKNYGLIEDEIQRKNSNAELHFIKLSKLKATNLDLVSNLNNEKSKNIKTISSYYWHCIDI